MMWFTILGMACITYLNRFIFIAPGLSYQPGEKLSRFLSFASLAVLTAIWTPMVVKFESQTGFGLAGWDYLLGSSAAGVLILLRLPSLLVVLISTGIFFGVRFLIS